MPDLMDDVVALAKRRGIAFQSSELYGGLRSSWDYGPLGVELRRNVREAWWRATVQLRHDVVGLEAAVDHVPARVGGLRARRDVPRPARGMPRVPPAVPCGPPRTRTRTA